MQPDALFVYGTLKRGQINHRLLAPYALSVEPATYRGLLYDLGEFPALTEGEGTVHGDLVRIAPEHLDGVLAQADRLEGYDASHEAASYYLRRVLRVCLAGGDEAEAFGYLYNTGHPALPPLRLLSLVPDGSWQPGHEPPEGSEEFERYRRLVRRYAREGT